MATITKRPRTVARGVDGEWAMPVPGTEVATTAPPWDEPPPDEQTETDRVMQLMRGVSGMDRASVKVYKVESGVSAFCDNYQPAEFEDGDYSKIRDAYGAGKYKIMLYGVHPETQNFGLLARENVTLMESRTPKNNPVQPQQNDAMAQVLQSIVDNQRQTNEAVLALRSAPAVDPMAQMTQMLSLMTMMRNAMGIDNQPKASGLSEIIASIKELRGVASEIIPERDSEPSMMSMLPQLLEVVKSGVENRPQPTAPVYQPLPQVQIPPTFQPNPIETMNPTPQDDMKLNQMFELKKSLGELIVMAKNGAPSSAGAEMVYEKLPDEIIDILYEANWFEMLALVDSEAKSVETWLRAARDEAIALFDAPDTEPVEPTQ